MEKHDDAGHGACGMVLGEDVGSSILKGLIIHRKTELFR